MSVMRRMKFAAGGALEVIEYPMNPRLPRYNGVAVCNVGDHHPCGWYGNGGVFRPDLAYFEDLAANYDPLFFVATLNLGHNDFWSWLADPSEKPALGLVSRLYTAGKGDDAQLVADFANLDPLLADEIDGGRWPNRSAEWVDAYDDFEWLKSNRPPDELPELESLFFYDKFARYFTGCAALGLSWPAVVGMGPWPSRSQESADDEMVKLPAAMRMPIPRAASQADVRRPRVFSLIPIEQEGTPMAGEKPKVGSPPEEGGSVTTATTTVDPVVAGEIKPASEPTVAAADTVTRAEFDAERERRAHLELIVAAKDRNDDVASRLRAHLADGRLTAQPQREAYTRLASQLHGTPPGKLMQANGAELQLEVSALDDLDAIIREFPAQASFKLHAHEEPGASDSDKNPAATERSEAVRKAGEMMGVTTPGTNKGGDQ